MTKSRSTLCCSDECHKKYRVIVQTEYAHRKQAQKQIEKQEKEKQLKLQKEMKKKKKETKRFNSIKAKIKFPKYMKERIIQYVNQNQFDLVYQFIENRLAKKFQYLGELNKKTILAILLNNSDETIEKLEEYLMQIIYSNIQI